ncbi:hypothetical protein ACIREM_42900 [Streptomyces shenzhenensis]|uniref:hypothetical protein n=1 Tax=Streptomyces shenzhenensis TaxID=943815 RepID=UPI003816E255
MAYLCGNGDPLLAVVYLALAISSFCQEIIQSEMFPARWRGRRFGFAQSGFLAGDAIGGTVGAVVLTHGGTSGLLFIYAGTSAVTAVVYPVFIPRMQRSTEDGTVSSGTPGESAEAGTTPR